MNDTLWSKSASQLAALIRARDVSSREVVQAFLERIDAVNDKVNAVTVVLADSALAAADIADKQTPVGPLHGVPFTIKENIDCVGSATTNGVPLLAEAMPTEDAPVVARMKTAGAIPLARTNLPELGLRISTDNPLRGRTNNPWDETRTAGGSSGGEASALATGMSPLGLGNDIGGSLRNPAFCCGITSLKPTTGRIPSATTIPPSERNLSWQLMCVEGPMARRVADLQLALPVLAGRHARDPVSVDAPLAGPAPEQRRAALVTEVPGVELPAVTVDAVKRAGEALAAAGWSVEEAVPPELERITEIWAHVLTADFVSEMELLSQVLSPRPFKVVEKMAENFPPQAATPTLVHTERWRLSCAWTEFFAHYPLIIGPTWTSLPFLHDADLDAGNETLTMDTLRFITPGNLLGIPSVAVPTGVVDGLPTGVQIYADRWREDLCLDGASIVENALGVITPIDPRF